MQDDYDFMQILGSARSGKTSFISPPYWSLRNYKVSWLDRLRFWLFLQKLRYRHLFVCKGNRDL